MDPFTIAALIKAGGSALSGLGSNIAAKDQVKDDKTRADVALGRARGMARDAKQRREEYGLGPSYSQLKSLVMQDPTSDYLRQQAQRQEASSLGALSSAGARAALGGVQATARASQDRLAQIAADEQIRRQQGLQVVGEAEQRVARNQLDDARTDLDLGRARVEQALGAKFSAEDASRLRKSTLAQSGIGVGETLSMGIAGRDGKFDGLDASLLNMLNAKNGAILRGKTPGDFSHEDNPIDIVRDGEKIGEMTGGEGIVSPEDLGKLEQLAGDGKSPLHSFVKELIRKLEKNGSE